jgi:3-hydroxypropionate dehydrogenase (NADP+)
VVGAGDTGRGWAALCVAAGWPVVLFDSMGDAANNAPDDVMKRARNLVDLGRANAGELETGMSAFTVGRSLLHATTDATWIIECITEDLITKQKLFENLESVAPKARLVTSSSTALGPKDIAARCRRPDRVLVAHPINPVELIPLVELVPGPGTDSALVELLKGWLRALGRVPVTIRKATPGMVAGRIAAAVWREAIELVLTGVIDVDDLDRAASVGPALSLAAAGPHLTYHLAAGKEGATGHLQRMLVSFERSWSQLAKWEKLEPDQQQRIIQAIQAAYADKTEVLRAARDRRLAATLRAMEQARQG